MSTEWRTEEGQVVAVTRWGGASRGVRVEVEVPDAEWEAVEWVVSESGSERVSRSELESRGTVVRWDRWRANSRRRSLERSAQRWAHEPSVAHALLSAAQSVE